LRIQRFSSGLSQCVLVFTGRHTGPAVGGTSVGIDQKPPTGFCRRGFIFISRQREVYKFYARRNRQEGSARTSSTEETTPWFVVYRVRHHCFSTSSGTAAWQLKQSILTAV
jgi:hypothetical protein